MIFLYIYIYIYLYDNIGSKRKTFLFCIKKYSCFEIMYTYGDYVRTIKLLLKKLE